MTALDDTVGRRKILCGFCAWLGILAAGPSLRAQDNSLPFCGYSIDSNTWFGAGTREYQGRRAGDDDRSGVPEVVRQIMRSLRIEADFDILIMAGNDNAFAAIAGGRRIIGVDIGFAKRLDRLAGTRWAAISVIAHEVGHHIAGFTADGFRGELNADYWSGQALQRLKSSRRAATKAIMAYGTEWDTDTHPNKWARAAKIEQGWDDAAHGHIDYSHCLDCR